ncbi:MAG: 16S rRNA (guanine(527)-N(7))-methyltransferase RsmG, partial [Clostridia bacterium]|nr:16S rRNA (guanine(527)-N(7))-methyltransferase RsmG [Clostridia bacterium]
MRERLVKGFLDLKMEVSEEQIEKFIKYAKLLVEWNEKMNLTAITDPIEIAEKHFLDSAMCLKCGINGKVIDVGTGAGFPGIVLKILNPEIELCLLDSLQKRITFLQEVCKELKLDNVTFVHARAEDGGRDKAL